MAAITDTLAYTGRNLFERKVHSGVTVNYNSKEFGRLDITIPNDFSRLKLVACSIGGQSATTLPAITAGEICSFELRRGGVLVWGPITSKLAMIFATTSETPTNQIWSFDRDELNDFPTLLPGDILRVQFPPLDDDATPTADVNYNLDFDVIHN